MAKKEKRFIIKEEQSLGLGAIQIVVDRLSDGFFLTGRGF